MKVKQLFAILIMISAILAASLAAGCTDKKTERISVVLMENEEFYVPTSEYSFILKDASVAYKEDRATIDIYQNRQYVERVFFNDASGRITIPNSSVGIQLVNSGDISAEFLIYKDPG